MTMRVVDVMEERIRFTLLTRDGADDPVDRYGARKPSGAEPYRRRSRVRR